MNWKRLLSSPPPAAVWVLDRHLVGVVRRGANGLDSRSAALDEAIAEVGPVGLQSLDAARLAPAMARAMDGAPTPRRAAVVVPTSWLRCYLLDFDHLPRRQAEVTDVLRWRLKKLLPVPPADLRIAWTVFARERSRRVLCLAGLEKPLAALETAFTAAGVSPGLITPHLLALSAPVGRSDGPHLFVQHEAGFQSMLLTLDGAPVFIRTKPVAGDEDEIDTSELRLGDAYIRDSLEVSGSIRVTVATKSERGGELLREWWSDRRDMAVEPTAAIDGDPGEIGPSRLLAATSILDGSRS